MIPAYISAVAGLRGAGLRRRCGAYTAPEGDDGLHAMYPKQHWSMLGPNLDQALRGRLLAAKLPLGSGRVSPLLLGASQHPCRNTPRKLGGVAAVPVYANDVKCLRPLCVLPWSVLSPGFQHSNLNPPICPRGEPEAGFPAYLDTVAPLHPLTSYEPWFPCPGIFN